MKSGAFLFRNPIKKWVSESCAELAFFPKNRIVYGFLFCNFTFMKKHLFLLALLAFFTSSFAVDTLEIFALRVQFKQESPDNSLTTGTGRFDSDSDTSNANYSLDPSGHRASAAYWQKHFEFAKNYYKAVSNGNLVITARIFPSGEPYTVNHYIIDYNRTSKKKGEKTAEFDEARSRDYMNFIWDAVTEANRSNDTLDNPFKVPQPKSSNKKRAYMIIHAGASRLVDGGSMGTNNADTPGDFMDVYVVQDYWSYLDTADSERKCAKDIRGMILPGSTLDTLKTIMVTSETASQDGLNWGINGVIVNQIGRELGMPNTYDVVKGISRLGYFDLMDFAGYNAGNGFFPVLPSAWVRSYMGWAKVQTVYPPDSKSLTRNIVAAGSGEGTEIVKVPLAANEYLLIENRERSAGDSAKIAVSYVPASDVAAESDYEVVTKVYPVDSLYTAFEDSICDEKGKCVKNRKKLSGVIVDVSSFDAGLPASGIAVWKVNDWYLREALPYGVTNFWGGDTLRDHQYGLMLTEADGVLSIGKTFKNALGQDAYDYGSGADLIPHWRKGKNSPKDTVWSIKPSGYGNTKTTMGGHTGITVTAKKTKNAHMEKNANAFMGDSVFNFAASSIPVTISWASHALIPGSLFPKNVGLNASVRGAVALDYPEGMSVGAGEKLIVFGSEDGTLQAMSAFGQPLQESDTTVWTRALSLADSVDSVALYRLGSSLGKLLGVAASGDTVYSLHQNKGLAQTVLSSAIDQIQFDRKLAGIANPLVGPMVWNASVFVADNENLYRYKTANLSKDAFALPENFEPQDMALCPDGDLANVALVGKNAELALYKAEEGRIQKLPSPKIRAKNLFDIKKQSFRIACSDFDRDGKSEMFILGSRGYAAMVRADDSASVVFAPRSFKRGNDGVVDFYDETSPIAIGDVNGDGYPEAVFLGNNLVYAVDRSGVVISGFPIRITKNTPETSFLSDPLIVDVTGDSLPEILVGTNGGVLHAFNSNGKSVTDGFPISAGNFEYGETVHPMAFFVAKTIDSVSGPQLYAFQRRFVTGYNLAKSSALAETDAKVWSVPGSGNGRTNYFDASKLPEPAEVKAVAKIEEFFVYPNPVRGGIANARFSLGMSAKSVTIEFYDISGRLVFSKKLGKANQGNNQIDQMDISHLGSDVYSVRLKVNFDSGKKKEKFYRVGVVR